MDNERFTKDAKYKAFMLVFKFYQAQEAKLKKDTKEIVEAFNRDIQKQEKEQQKLEMMKEHPEWFESTSPKEYGMKLINTRKRQKR